MGMLDEIDDDDYTLEVIKLPIGIAVDSDPVGIVYLTVILNKCYVVFCVPLLSQ